MTPGPQHTPKTPLKCAVRVSNPGPADYLSAGPADAAGFRCARKSTVSRWFWVRTVASRYRTIPADRLPQKVQRRPLGARGTSGSYQCDTVPRGMARHRDVDVGHGQCRARRPSSAHHRAGLRGRSCPPVVLLAATHSVALLVRTPGRWRDLLVGSCNDSGAGGVCVRAVV